MLTANRIQQLFDEAFKSSPWNALLQSQAHQNAPRVWGDDDSVLVEVDVPGRSLEDVEVVAEKNILKIELKELNSSDDGDLRVRERLNQAGTAQLVMPFRIDPDRTDLSLKNGVLRIVVRKPETEQPRKLQIRQE